MTPAEHAKAIEDAAVAYAETTHTKDSYGARQGLKAAIIAGVGAAPAAPDVAAELEEVKTVCAEAYQVVGALLADAGRFDSPDGQKILDNLAEQRLRHTDVLPWASKAAPDGWQLVPLEPTNAMLDALEEGGCSEGNYKAALAAAPKP